MVKTLQAVKRPTIMPMASAGTLEATITSKHSKNMPAMITLSGGSLGLYI
jgi:hypothetical protein